MAASNRYRHKEERIEIQEVRLKGAHDVVKLKSSPTLLIGKYWHTIRMLDLYVVFHTLWDSFAFEVPRGEGLRTDIGMVYRGAQFSIEVDLGTEDIKKLVIPKIELYRQYAKPGEKVIFVMTDEFSNREDDPELREEKIAKRVTKRGAELLDYLESELLGNFVTVTRLSNFLKYPLGNILNSPKDGRVTLDDLWSDSLSLRQ